MEKIMSDIETMYKKIKIKDLTNISVKTKFLFKLMRELKKGGHRILVFSMSKKMLDLLQLMLKHGSNHDIGKHVRIDGSTDISIREQICKDFNRDSSIFCCLLTTKVGGFGLNLTGADRAVILDPDWNPANDNQAVDRCYRIGQKKDVIVYRLVSIGGLEERIYRR
jgi:SNF2 family DNA or RNA helicase